MLKKAIVEKTLVNRTSSLETTKALKQAGVLTEVAVQQTEAQLLNAKARLIDLNKQIALTENTLSILLGHGPRAIVRASLDEQELKAPISTGYPGSIISKQTRCYGS